MTFAFWKACALHAQQCFNVSLFKGSWQRWVMYKQADDILKRALPAWTRKSLLVACKGSSGPLLENLQSFVINAVIGGCWKCSLSSCQGMWVLQKAVDASRNNLLVCSRWHRAPALAKLSSKQWNAQSFSLPMLSQWHQYHPVIRQLHHPVWQGWAVLPLHFRAGSPSPHSCQLS